MPTTHADTITSIITLLDTTATDRATASIIADAIAELEALRARVDAQPSGEVTAPHGFVILPNGNAIRMSSVVSVVAREEFYSSPALVAVRHGPHGCFSDTIDCETFGEACAMRDRIIADLCTACTAGSAEVLP